MIQHTQQHTTEAMSFDWYIGYVNGCTDGEEACISFSNNVKVELEVTKGERFGWVVSDFEISFSVLKRISRLHPIDKSSTGWHKFTTMDFMHYMGVDTGRFKNGVHYVQLEYEPSDGLSTVWTPEGLKELATLFPLLGCSQEDANTFLSWIDNYKFVGDYYIESIRKKREELIKSNADGYMMDSYQLSKILGIRPDSIRMTKCRHTDKLIKGVHWKYSTRGNRTLLFTKLGCLVMSSLVGTEEAQRTRGFLELAFGVTIEELTLAA